MFACVFAYVCLQLVMKQIVSVKARRASKGNQTGENVQIFGDHERLLMLSLSGVHFYAHSQ